VTTSPPNAQGPIVVDELDFGHSLPKIQGIDKRAEDEQLHLELDIFYPGGLYFSVSTEIWINWPRERFASLPVSISIGLASLTGKVSFTCPFERDTIFVMGLIGEPDLLFEVGSLLGYKTELRDVTKISEVITRQTEEVIRQNLVLPNGLAFRLPNKERPFMAKLVRDVANNRRGSFDSGDMEYDEEPKIANTWKQERRPAFEKKRRTDEGNDETVGPERRPRGRRTFTTTNNKRK